MLKQDVPLRTGWFGYRKLDVENCIAHLCAVHEMDTRLARQNRQGMEGTMAQIRQENSALRQRLAQQAAVQTAAVVNADAVREQLDQLHRKLSAARAEIRRYQTRMFAFERQMIALRRENAELEAACERAQEEALLAAARAEKAEQALQLAREQAAKQAAACPPQPAPEPPAEEAAVCCAAPVLPQPEAPPVQEPVWQPTTELEKLSVELIHQFDAWMAQ